MTRPVLLVAGAALLLGALGCDRAGAPSPEAALLDDPPAAADVVLDGALLPLVKGNRWVMATMTDRPGPTDTVVVGDPVRVGAHTGVEVTTLRQGKPWRREVYRDGGDALYLLAIAETTRPYMTLEPPLPLVAQPPVPGASLRWNGVLRIGGKPAAADAFSRVTSLDTVQTARQGRFRAWQIETILTVHPDRGAPIPFAAIRWLSAGVGFVQRVYADQEKSCRAQLTDLDLKGNR